MKLMRRYAIVLAFQAIYLASAGCASVLPIGSSKVDHDTAAGTLTTTLQQAGGFSLLGVAGVALIFAGAIVWAVLGNRRRGLLMIAVGASLNAGMIIVLEFMSYLFWPLLIALVLAGVGVSAPWFIGRWHAIRGKV